MPGRRSTSDASRAPRNRQAYEDSGRTGRRSDCHGISDGDQRAADKDEVAQAVEAAELTHRVGEVELRLLHDFFAFAALGERYAALA